MAKPRGEPSDVLHRSAQAAVLGALAARQDDPFELMLTVRPYEVRGLFTPSCCSNSQPQPWHEPAHRAMSACALRG